MHHMLLPLVRLEIYDDIPHLLYFQMQLQKYKLHAAYLAQNLERALCSSIKDYVPKN